ncbi:hypothetical protein Droror1_Dr00001421 [Drosera rotundifolia]
MHEHGDSTDSSNFVDLDWLSTSTDDDFMDRSSHITRLSSENVMNGLIGETSTSSSAYGASMKIRDQGGSDISYDDNVDKSVPEEFPDSFARWVHFGETLCH